ncbi:MAG: hypothetical protein PUE47_05070 [Lachnospiraceae bacterium]|nr:hypothetical protein [Lachnospiraceae bacterium]
MVKCPGSHIIRNLLRFAPGLLSVLCCLAVRNMIYYAPGRGMKKVQVRVGFRKNSYLTGRIREADRGEKYQQNYT